MAFFVSSSPITVLKSINTLAPEDGSEENEGSAPAGSIAQDGSGDNWASPSDIVPNPTFSSFIDDYVAIYNDISMMSSATSIPSHVTAVASRDGMSKEIPVIAIGTIFAAAGLVGGVFLLCRWFIRRRVRRLVRGPRALAPASVGEDTEFTSVAMPETNAETNLAGRSN
jgi:hypothetical protein